MKLPGRRRLRYRSTFGMILNTESPGSFSASSFCKLGESEEEGKDSFFSSSHLLSLHLTCSGHEEEVSSPSSIVRVVLFSCTWCLFPDQVGGWSNSKVWDLNDCRIFGASKRFKKDEPRRMEGVTKSVFWLFRRESEVG